MYIKRKKIVGNKYSKISVKFSQPRTSTLRARQTIKIYFHVAVSCPSFSPPCILIMMAMATVSLGSPESAGENTFSVLLLAPFLFIYYLFAVFLRESCFADFHSKRAGSLVTSSVSYKLLVVCRLICDTDNYKHFFSFFLLFLIFFYF